MTCPKCGHFRAMHEYLRRVDGAVVRERLCRRCRRRGT